MTAVFQVPVIYHDVQGPDAIRQALASLARLTGVADNVFGRIKTRVENEKSKLDHIGSRLTAAESKLNSIKSAPSGKVVISPANFPVQESFPKPFQPLFVTSGVKTNVRQDMQRELLPETATLNLQSSATTQSARSVEVSASPAEAASSTSSSEVTSLRRIPAHVNTVDGLLVFSSPRNAYGNTSASVRPREPVIQDHNKLDDLFDEETVFRADILNNIDRFALRYRPGGVNAPDVRQKMPGALPGPANIASNIAATVMFEGNTDVLIPFLPPSDLPEVISTTTPAQPDVPSPAPPVLPPTPTPPTPSPSPVLPVLPPTPSPAPPVLPPTPIPPTPSPAPPVLPLIPIPPPPPVSPNLVNTRSADPPRPPPMLPPNFFDAPASSVVAVTRDEDTGGALDAQSVQFALSRLRPANDRNRAPAPVRPIVHNPSTLVDALSERFAQMRPAIDGTDDAQDKEESWSDDEH